MKELRTLATGGTLIGADEPLSGQAAEDFMAGIAASGAVNSVEPDARMRAALTPDDTRYSEQWDFTAANGMRIPGAWDVATGTGVTVAVIDTGITAHPDLDANVLPATTSSRTPRQRATATAGIPTPRTRATGTPLENAASPRPGIPPGTARTWPAPSPQSP